MVTRPTWITYSLLLLNFAVTSNAVQFPGPGDPCGTFYYMNSGSPNLVVACNLTEPSCEEWRTLSKTMVDFALVPAMNWAVFGYQGGWQIFDADSWTLVGEAIGNPSEKVAVEVDSRGSIYTQQNGQSGSLWTVITYEGGTPVTSEEDQVTADGYVTKTTTFTFDDSTKQMYTAVENVGVMTADISEYGSPIEFHQLPIEDVEILYMKVYNGTLYYIRSDKIYDVHCYNGGTCAKYPTDLEHGISFGFYGNYLLSPNPLGSDLYGVFFDLTTRDYVNDFLLSPEKDYFDSIVVAESFFIEEECGSETELTLTDVDDDQIEDDVLVVINPARLRLKNSHPIVLAVLHPPFVDAFEFNRTVPDGAPEGATVGRRANRTTITLNADSLHSQQSLGVFTHKFNTNSEVVSVHTVVQWGGKLVFGKPTRTAYIGDMVQLATGVPRGRRRKWRLNGGVVHRYSGLASIEISSVNRSHAGIWESYLNRHYASRKHAVMRLIVSECDRMSFNAPSCDQSTARECGNGGYLRYDVDACICAPGFQGENCETSSGIGKYGQKGQFECPNQDLDNPCSGLLICQPDPMGCSCAAGLKGPDCEEPCDIDTYGAGCGGICHCDVSGECDPVTGVCPGGCEYGYEGNNCQILMHPL